MPAHRPTALSVLFVSALVPTLAQAQQSPAAPVETLEAMTITGQAATKTETPFNEVPQALSVIENEAWQTRGARSVQRSVDYTPGVFTHHTSASNRSDCLVLRGISDDSFGIHMRE